MDGGEYVSMAGEFNDLKKVLNFLACYFTFKQRLRCVITIGVPIKCSFLLLGYQRAVGCD